MDAWTNATLGDFITLQRGFDITKKDQTAGKYPVISSSGITSQHDQFKVKGPGVIIGRKGTLGTAFFTNCAYWPHDTTLWVKDFKGNDPKFIYYLLKKLPLGKLDSGSANPTLNRNFAHKVKVSIPDLSIQQKIASVLSCLDDKIELNNRINSELEAMAKLIYEYWFVQFDFPFDFAQGKSDVTSSGVEKPYKSSGGKMVWNKELKREIPEGWEIVGLEDLAEFNPSLKIERNSEAPYLGMTAISTTGYMTDLPEKKEFSGGIKFQNGDIVVARITPCLENGKTALITMLDGGSIGFGSTEFINIRAKEKSHVSFLAILSRSDLFRHYAISKMTGTSGRKRVDAKELAKFQLAKPSSELLKKYDEIVNPYFEKMTFNSKQNQELASLRDWLLPMLMNGQVTVADAEVMVEEKLGMVAEERGMYNAKK